MDVFLETLGGGGGGGRAVPRVSRDDGKGRSVLTVIGAGAADDELFIGFTGGGAGAMAKCKGTVENNGGGVLVLDLAALALDP